MFIFLYGIIFCWFGISAAALAMSYRIPPHYENKLRHVVECFHLTLRIIGYYDHLFQVVCCTCQL